MIVASLERLSSEEVFEAFEELDDLPPEVVRDALAASTGPAPDPEQLDDATRSAHGLPPRALRLRTIALVKDADIFDLGEVAETQVRRAGQTWDGRDLAVEDRLDDEIDGSFAGTLEHRVLAEVGGANAPLFDVVLYAGDAGAIFRAGTSEQVGAIAYSTVEMQDRRARIAIQAALASAVIEPAPSAAHASDESPSAEPSTLSVPVISSEPPTQKATAGGAPAVAGQAKETSAKTSAAAKASSAKRAGAASKQAPAKGASTKRGASAKKTSAKKTPAKAPPAKGASAKASSKKTSAKAAPPKDASAKASSKKTSAKATPSKDTAAKSSKKTSAKAAPSKAAPAKQSSATKASAKASKSKVKASSAETKSADAPSSSKRAAAKKS
ncbi:MAG: hypothetical protein KF894_34260 [Labilithrix sp.]|nr:hypothetical protein [Labilithrix sp.]